MISEVIQQLNWIDYAIFAIVGISAVISFFRGFVREAISVLAWVIGFILALKYSLFAQVYLQSLVSHESIRYFICFVGIFLGVVIIGLLINLLIGFLLKSSGLSFVDRFIGIIFGAVRGMAVVAVLLLALTNVGTLQDSLPLNKSKLAVRFKPVVLWLDGFLPDKMKQMRGWVMGDFKNHQAPNIIKKKQTEGEHFSF